ncbi:MAG TPA: nuclear transport factor 2 family protein [Solirubrobacterales bacterium]|nr:nuclear transport factor 2 family protein [Solirubrobacterales bacterium]
MSQENVETFKRAADAYNRRDIDALLRELDPEVEWRSAILMPLGREARVHRGDQSVREGLRDLYEALSEFHVEYSEIRDLSDRIVGIGRVRIRERHRGVEIESPLISVIDVKDGKGIRVWNYLDPKEALEAAGLSE